MQVLTNVKNVFISKINLGEKLEREGINKPLLFVFFWGALFPRTADPFPTPYAFTLYPYITSCNWTMSQVNALLARYFGSLGSSQSQCPAER